MHLIILMQKFDICICLIDFDISYEGRSSTLALLDNIRAISFEHFRLYDTSRQFLSGSFDKKRLFQKTDPYTIRKTKKSTFVIKSLFYQTLNTQRNEKYHINITQNLPTPIVPNKPIFYWKVNFFLKS